MTVPTERKYNIIGIFNMVGGVSGMLSIALLVWNGGKVVAMVENHEQRLEGIEVRGSSGLQRHEALDDQRVGDITSRLRRCEDDGAQIRATLADIKGDLREIKAHLGIKNGEIIK